MWVAATAVLVSGRTLSKAELRAQEVVLALEFICGRLGLQLSKPKSVVMPVGRRTAKSVDFLPPRFLDESEVPAVEIQRFLGVELDSFLTFTALGNLDVYTRSRMRVTGRPTRGRHTRRPGGRVVCTGIDNPVSNVFPASRPVWQWGGTHYYFYLALQN